MFSSGEKISDFIDFPINGVDMRQFVGSLKDEVDPVMYDLYGISNHFGGVGGGHYTAYSYNKVLDKWFEYDDSHVTEIRNLDEIKTKAAYVLFFRKRE